MREVFQYALLGLGAGALYVVLAQGVVLIFRGSGVLNLAHGAFAMLAAYSYNDLHGSSGWPVWQAMVVVVVGTACLGLFTDAVIMRALKRASPLARLIATLGVLIIASSVATLHWGASPKVVLPIITPKEVDLLGVSVTSDRLWLAAIAAALTIALAAVWRYTRLGWIAEAVAESELSAGSLGWSPQVVSSATWTIGAGLAGLAGILISPITQLNQSALTFLIIPTLAATLIGGFRSFGLTFAGGIFIGVAQSLAGHYIHVQGASDALPFVVIVVVLIATGTSLPLRGHVLDRMPSVGLGRIDLRYAVVGAVLAGAVTLLVRAGDWQAMFATTFAIAIILLSLVVLVGYAGQLSLAQYAVAGLGALIAARLVAAQGWPFPLAVGGGVAAASAIGLLFALPALRTRGVNLAVVTMGLGLAAQSLVFNNAKYTGGISGTTVGSQSLFGLSIDPIRYPVRYSMLVLVCFIVCCLIVANIRRSPSGRRMLALRSNERAAAALGVNVIGTKLYAFALSGALAGLGGALLGFQSTTVSFTAYDPLSSINAVAFAVIGGIGFVVGTVPGAILSPQSLTSLIHGEDVQRYLPLVGGVGLIVTLIQNPDGVAAAVVRPLRALAAKLRVPPRRVTHRRDERTVPRVPPRELRVADLSVRYGGVVAVDGVNLSVGPGEIVALIGPNGAGKTSLMDALTGFARCRGVIELSGVDLAAMPAHRRAAAGLARSWQSVELFEDLTVLENLLAASDRPRRLGALTDVVKPPAQELPPAVSAVVAEFGLEDCLENYPEELSYGRRRLVAIARSVSMSPSVLLLDEPVAGLDDEESQEFASLVRQLATGWGMGVLTIEHDMDFVMALADRVVVLDFGRQVAAGRPGEIQRDPAALAAYLGAETPGADQKAPGDQQAVRP